MFLLLQRNVRYVALVLVIFVGAYFFFQTSGASYDSLTFAGLPADPNLTARIERSERTYQTVLENRQKLVKKHGPTASQIVMFPPDQDPWPAYTVWDFFPPAFDCPHDLERLGDLGDGGKWTCGISRIVEKPDCIIYSFGTDTSFSWENAILSRTAHCEVWGHSPELKARGFGWDMGLRAHFAKGVRLGGVDAKGKGKEPATWTLESLMQKYGHKHIDVLKIDIEGYEFTALRALVEPYLARGAPLPFGQLLIEVHAWGQRFDEFLAWFEMLERAGLRATSNEPNLVYANYNRQSGAELSEYTFLNIRGDNIFIMDPSEKQVVPSAAREPDVRNIRHRPRDN